MTNHGTNSIANDLNRKERTERKEGPAFLLSGRGFVIYAFCVVEAALNLELLLRAPSV